jgi:hypothetical protein
MIDIAYDESSGSPFLMRHVSGAQYSDFGGSTNVASRVANLQFESIGSVGFWLKTDDPDIQVSMALDDPTTGDRGIWRNVIADNEWHKYEWFLDEASEWDVWLAGANGQIDGLNVSIDSIQFVGARDATIYLDDVFWNPQAIYVPPTPGDFNGDGLVNGADLLLWQGGYGLSGGATLLDGDADGDADVDGRDLLIWQRNITQSGSITTVPEANTLVLCVVLLAGMASSFRRATSCSKP